MGLDFTNPHLRRFEKMSKQKRSIENITGLWKRTSTNRVGKDGKPEVYYVGTPVRIAKEGERRCL